MTLEKMDRANKIQSRIKELERMKSWLAEFKHTSISVVASGCSINDIIHVSDEMKSEMYQRCLKEIEALKTEFIEL